MQWQIQDFPGGANLLLPPATKLGQGNIFRSVCPHSVHRGGMRGCSGGVCMVAPQGRGLPGACVVALGGGVHGCSRGACMVARGACVVAPGGCVFCSGGCAWLLQGGMCGCSGGHAWLLGGHAWDTTRYGDTVNERAVRILLECILV